MLRLLTHPNVHFPGLRRAFEHQEWGVSLDEIVEYLCFYSNLIVVYFKEEIKFRRECYDKGYYYNRSLSSQERNAGLTTRREIPYVKHTRPQIVCENQWRQLYRFEEPVNSPTSTFPRVHRYHEPTKFKKRHDYGNESRLSLDVCRGVSTRSFHIYLDVAEHLHYINEYTQACEDCKADADKFVRKYARLGHRELHRPRFHPLFYPYVKSKDDTLDARDILLSDGLGAFREERGLPRIDFENRVRDRPSRKFIFHSLIIDQILEAKVEEYYPTDEDLKKFDDNTSLEEDFEIKIPTLPSPTNFEDPVDLEDDFVPVTFRGRKRKTFREYCRSVNPRRSPRFQAKSLRRSPRLSETGGSK